MSAATIYVYPSVGGTIWGNGNGFYCAYPNVQHPRCVSGDSACVDIHGNDYIYLRVSNYQLVKSVRVTITYACAPNCEDDYRRIAICDLYQNQNLSGVYIGRVAYGHLGSPAYPNDSVQTVNLTSNNLRLGHVPSDDRSCLNYYDGYHSHMEFSYGSTSGWVNGTLVCNTTIGTSTYIYAMTYNW